MATGSNVFRVVLTVMFPSTRSSCAKMPNFDRLRTTSGHASFRYCSLYLGKSTIKEDSSENGPVGLSSGLNLSICMYVSYACKRRVVVAGL